MDKQLDIVEIIYYIGGAIISLGIWILVWQNWSTLGFITKIITTIGVFLASYIVGLFFGKNKKLNGIGSASFLISALVLPMGLYVILNKMGIDVGSAISASLVFGTCFIVYLISYTALRRNIFTLFSIIFGTAFLFAIADFLNKNIHLLGKHFFEFMVFFAGLLYLLMGYIFSKKAKPGLTDFLYGVGVLGILGAVFSLSGWAPNQNGFFELIFPLLVLATIFASTNLKSKYCLIFGSIFFVFYLLKITAEYSTGGLGWPLYLIFVGLIFIAIGYFYVRLKRKYAPA